MSSDALTWLKAATSIVSAGAYDDRPTHSYASAGGSIISATSAIHNHYQSLVPYTGKYALQKIKETNAQEKSELQRLNHQLQVYLENVKKLESLNTSLLSEVDNSKTSRRNSGATTVTEIQNLESLRTRLEQEQSGAVRNRVRIEDSERFSAFLNQRIQFFQNESELTRQKLQSLQVHLSGVSTQRENLRRGSKNLEDEIKREFERQLQAEKEFDQLRGALREARGKNQKIEYEIKTIMEMVTFYKNTYSEEINSLKVQNKKPLISASDLNKFYREELDLAIKQIR
jgi:chromosome segregation ATPase